MSDPLSVARPFRTLGVRPFLWAQPADLSQLQTQFHKLSRQFHPDRFINASDEDRAEAEARSAELNFDYSRLRDTWSLLETVLNDREEATPSRSGSSAPPPDLAEDYFDLQEAWMEGDSSSPATQATVSNFLNRVAAARTQAEETVLEFARKFPFSGFGEAPAPWTREDLEKLKSAVHNVRYYRSFERDIRSKFLKS